MNRLSWDSTAPRRHTGVRVQQQPRPESPSAFADAADLLHVACDRRQRIHGF